MNTVQNDIWTLVGLLGAGILPLALLLLVFKPKPFKPRPGPPAEAYKEALTENEAYMFRPEQEESIPGDEPLSAWQRVLYEVGVVIGAMTVSFCFLFCIKLYLYLKT